MTNSNRSYWVSDPMRGRVITETRTITNTGTFVPQWGYNSADQVDWMKYPAGNNREVGEQVSYSYDNRMALESLYSQTSSYYYVKNTSYDVAGRVTLRWMGSVTGMPAYPLLQTSFGYYPWSGQGGRLQTLQSGWYTQTTSLQNLAYSYDAVGNVSSIVDANAGGTQTQSFSYDALSRLTSASASGGTGGLYSEGYTFDPTTGNLASKSGVSYSYTDTLHAHAVTLLSNGDSFLYDANGNMRKRNVGGSTYNLTHDAENRLVGVTGAITAAFKYDGDGNRVQGTLGGVTTTYIGNYYEWTSAGSTQYYGVYPERQRRGGSQRIAMRRSGYSQDNGLFWLFGDHLGSTSVTANSAGGYFGEVRYKAWGETRYSAGNTPTTFRFTGQRQEADLGLYFYNARWYDPYLNRWIQPDIIIPDPYNPLDWDRYSFVRNNPVKYIDADGHFPIFPVLAIIGAFIFFSQVPSDQYQSNPANWGDPGVQLFGLTLMLAPTIAQAACLNDGDCTNEANITKQTLESVNQDGDPLNELQAAAKTAESVNDKLYRYLLNSDPRSVGYDKAKWFEQALGYTRDNMTDLAKQIVFDPSKAVQTKVTEYGVYYNQWITITGANGKVIDVKFAWIKLVDGIVKLVTAIPTKK